MLHAELGTDRVVSGSDQDPAWGWTWLQRGGLLRQLSLRILYFGNLRIVWTSGLYGGGEAGSGAGVRQRSRYFITKLILYCTLVGLLY